MIRGQEPQHTDADNLDEHDQPTEPMPPIVTPTFPGNPQGAYPVDYGMLPAPQFQEQPFPQHYVPGIPQQPAPQNVPGGNPFQPALPGGRKGKKRQPEPLGVPGAPVQPPAQPGQVLKPTRRRATPALVGLFFVAVQLLLLARFMLGIINPAGNATWIAIVYALSEVFLLPVQYLLQQLSLPFTLGAELSTLLAILLYGILSRILVRLLKVILRTR